LCCFDTRRRCLLFCLLPSGVTFAVFLGLMLFFFWPRCLTIEPLDDTLKLGSFKFTSSLFNPSISFTGSMDVKVTNENFWKFDLDSVNIKGYYKGVLIGTGHVAGSLSIPLRDATIFSIKFYSSEGATKNLGSLLQVVAQYTRDCGVPPKADQKWPLTLRADVYLTSSSSFQVEEEFNVPCRPEDAVGNVTGGVPGLVVNSGKRASKCWRWA